VHNNKRFSEDLDFDNFWLTMEEFDDLSKIIKGELEKQGFEIEIKNVYKWAYRCSIKLPKLLKQLWWSNLEDEKILIHIDTVSHNFQYTPDKKVLNKFWLVFKINSTPIDIIASQKIRAIFERKRAKWRDYFDLVFLLSKTTPNLEYLKVKMWFDSLEQAKNELLKFAWTQDLISLTKDVEPFLIDKENWKNNMKFFMDIIESEIK
jgi:predicted nucleotidyltransferase component of viral defense system